LEIEWSIMVWSKSRPFLRSLLPARTIPMGVVAGTCRNFVFCALLRPFSTTIVNRVFANGLVALFVILEICGDVVGVHSLRVAYLCNRRAARIGNKRFLLASFGSGLHGRSPCGSGLSGIADKYRNYPKYRIMSIADSMFFRRTGSAAASQSP